MTIFGSFLLVLELQRQTSGKDGARPDIFTEHFAQGLLSVYTIVSWSLLLSFGVAAMAVVLSSIAFDEIAAALICSAFVAIAVAVASSCIGAHKGIDRILWLRS